MSARQVRNDVKHFQTGVRAHPVLFDPAELGKQVLIVALARCGPDKDDMAFS